MFAFSSAPIQAMVLGFGLLIYDRILSQFSFRWSALIVVGAVGIIAAFLISNSPIGFVISNLTFSPQSGYYREWTWDLVGLHVSQSPWFGLGYGELPEDINHSIDSLWLVLAIQSGFPGAVLVALSLLGAAAVLTSGRNAGLTSTETKLAATLGIALFLTVYIRIHSAFMGYQFDSYRTVNRCESASK